VTTWTLRTPIQSEGPASWENRLFLRVKLDRGVSILEGPPGTFRRARFPSQDEIAASQPHFFMGGHEYEVDDTLKASLIASGVVDDSNFTDVATLHGFGSGLFGERGFGGV
jgi:hypothetical protein